MAMKIRLNVVEWIDGNYGKQTLCPLCHQEKDTTEHVFVCHEMGNEMGIGVGDLERGERMGEVVRLFRENEEKRKTLLIDEVQMNLNVYQNEGTL